MAFEISSTLLFFLAKELQVLKNGKIEKIYQLDKENIVFRIYKESTKKNLRINAPSIISLTEQEYEAPTIPPGFCMFLRKYLTNARIESIEQKEFERIKRGTYLINCSRGGVVDEDALVSALDSGILTAAALDVFSQEPVKNTRLYTHDKICMTPHIGASTREAQQKIGSRIVEIVKSFI